MSKLRAFNNVALSTEDQNSVQGQTGRYGFTIKFVGFKGGSGSKGGGFSGGGSKGGHGSRGGSYSGGGSSKRIYYYCGNSFSGSKSRYGW